ncbi:MAG TPA: TetR/AcrR family transcriptional regulator [Acidimicrobiales bacterium]
MTLAPTSPSTSTAASTSPTTGTTGTTTAPAGGQGARARILDRALDLISEHGAAGTSMRQLAGACGCNVATIYHYFPSKADLVRAVIEERRYGERMATEAPPADPALPPAERLATLLRWLWSHTVDEQVVLRLIIGEGLRGDEGAQSSAQTLVDALDAGLTEWLGDGFPELAARGVDPAIAARLVRRHLLSLVAEHLAAGDADADAAAAELGQVLFG